MEKANVTITLNKGNPDVLEFLQNYDMKVSGLNPGTWVQIVVTIDDNRGNVTNPDIQAHMLDETTTYINTRFKTPGERYREGSLTVTVRNVSADELLAKRVFRF